MPNLVTHYNLARVFYAKKVENGFLKGNFECLALGTQGPDPLFYEGIVPTRALRLRLASAKLGNQIHRSTGEKFISLLIDQIEINESARNDEYKAFVFGQFCHYVLDKVCHPYIYYFSGFDENGKLTGKYHFSHAHFESEIDVAMALTNALEDKIKAPEQLFPTEKYLFEAIENGMTKAVSTMFDRKLPANYYKNAVLNMKSVVRLANNLNPFWAKIFGKTRLCSLRLPKKVSRSVLNENKETWLDPVSGKERNESFVELFDNAYDIVCKAYDDVCKNGLTMETLKPYFDGLTYKGFEEGAKLQYWKNKKA